MTELGHNFLFQMTANGADRHIQPVDVAGCGTALRLIGHKVVILVLLVRRIAFAGQNVLIVILVFPLVFPIMADRVGIVAHERLEAICADEGRVALRLAGRLGDLRIPDMCVWIKRDHFRSGVCTIVAAGIGNLAVCSAGNCLGDDAVVPIVTGRRHKIIGVCIAADGACIGREAVFFARRRRNSHVICMDVRQFRNNLCTICTADGTDQLAHACLKDRWCNVFGFFKIVRFGLNADRTSGVGAVTCMFSDVDLRPIVPIMTGCGDDVRIGLAAILAGVENLAVLLAVSFRRDDAVVPNMLQRRSFRLHVGTLVYCICLGKITVDIFGRCEILVVVIVDRDELVDIRLDLALVIVEFDKHVADRVARQQVPDDFARVVDERLDLVQRLLLAFETRFTDRRTDHVVGKDVLQHVDLGSDVVEHVDHVAVILIAPVAEVSPHALVAEGRTLDRFQLCLKLCHMVENAVVLALGQHIIRIAVEVEQLAAAEMLRRVALVIHRLAAEIEQRMDKTLVNIHVFQLMSHDFHHAHLVDLGEQIADHSDIGIVLVDKLVVQRVRRGDDQIVQLLQILVKIGRVALDVRLHFKLKTILDADAVRLIGVDLR